ncbi:hypothetical protein J6590_108035, partial [Homalodisca vitripennis]
MSKFPCGICETGVKYQGIKCASSCKKWYHAKCLTWSYKKFKNLTDKDIKMWSCDTCKSNTINIENLTSTPTPQNHAHTDTSLSYTAIEDIQAKIADNENPDLNTSLTLAAEFGNILLEENTKLKQDLLDLTLRNSELAQRIKNQSSVSKAKDQAVIEELEDDKDALSNRITSLLETIKQLENQLDKEKTLRNELT